MEPGYHRSRSPGLAPAGLEAVIGLQDMGEAAGAASAAEYARWLHDLRNAVNTVSVASVVLRRLVAAGAPDTAIEVLSELDSACARCCALLHEPPRGG